MNPEHVARLKKGVLYWNDWRVNNEHSRGLPSPVDLSQTDLRGRDLSSADLRNADLHRAQLSQADLHFARLGGANLSEAVLCVGL